MQMQWTFSRSASCEWKGTLNEGSVMPPLTDSHNYICSVCFAGFHWLNTMRDQQHVFMIAVCLLPCVVKDSQCVHVNIMCCHTHRHTHGCMGKQQWCRRECSCSMSGEATYWHDPLNNRCSFTPLLIRANTHTRAHTYTHTHSGTHTYTLWLTEAKTLPSVHTCAIPECAPIMAPTYANNLWQRKAKEMRSAFFSAYLLRLLPGAGALIYCWLR